MVVPVGWRQLPPELVNDRQRFGPAHVSVTANHVGDDETAGARQALLDSGEQALKIDHVMQRLNCDHAVVLARRTPLVEVRRNKIQLLGNMLRTGGQSPASQHGVIEVEAVDHETRLSRCQKLGGDLDFKVAVPRSDAQKTDAPSGVALALASKRLVEKIRRALKSDGLQFRPDILVGPVVKNIRQIVNSLASPVEPLFFLETSRVIALRLRRFQSSRLLTMNPDIGPGLSLAEGSVDI